MTQFATEVYIKQIEELQELIASNPDYFFVCRDITNGITYRIKASALISSESVQAAWNSAFNYNDAQIVQANGKWWQSLITDGTTPNIGNFPIEGAFWHELPSSAANGSVAYWQAGVFNVAPQICVVKANGGTLPTDKAFLLSSATILPFNSTVSPDLDSVNWLPFGAGGGGGGSSVLSSNVILSTPLLGAANQDAYNVANEASKKKEYQIETNGETSGLLSFSQLEKIIAIPAKHNIDTLTITPVIGGTAIPLITAGGVVVTMPVNVAIGTYLVSLTYVVGMATSSTIIQTQLQ